MLWFSYGLAWVPVFCQHLGFCFLVDRLLPPFFLHLIILRVFLSPLMRSVVDFIVNIIAFMYLVEEATVAYIKSMLQMQSHYHGGMGTST